MNNDVQTNESHEEKEEICPVARCQRKIIQFVWYCGRIFEGGHIDSCPRADDNDEHLPMEELIVIMQR